MSECKHGETFVIDNCPVCGAPQCCSVCCNEQTLRDRIAELEREQNALKATIAASKVKADELIYTLEGGE